MSDFVRIAYGDNASTLRLEYDWPIIPTRVFAYFTAIPGGAAIDDDSAVPLTQNSLNADTSIGDLSFVFGSSPSTNPVPGDRFRIGASDDGPAEDVTCDYYDSKADTVYLTRPMADAHGSGDDVDGLFVTFDLDASTTTTWTLGLRGRIRWSPSDSNDTDIPIYPAISQEFRVVDSSYDDAGIRADFEAVYPSVYTIIEERWERIYDAARRRLRAMLKARDREIDSLADQSIFEPLMMELVYLLGAPRGDEWEYERSQAKMAFDQQFELIADSPIWFDDDQDDVLDDGEDTPIAMDDIPYGRGL